MQPWPDIKNNPYNSFHLQHSVTRRFPCHYSASIPDYSLFSSALYQGSPHALLTSVHPSLDRLSKISDSRQISNLSVRGRPPTCWWLTAWSPLHLITKIYCAPAQSYSAYATALSECGTSDQRIAVITDKAHLYGSRLLNQFLPIEKTDGEEFDRILAKLDKDDLPFVFWGTFGWISWVQSQNGSPAAMADLVVIEKIMSRLLELDETFEGGSIHLFFGGYHAAKPALFGGKPDLSKIHFEKALVLSKRRFLLIQTTYAATLARQTMDKELHDRLLKEVISFPLDSAPEFALTNRIAVKRARRLLADDYFAE